MTNALSCRCLPNKFNPLSFYEAYPLNSIISIPHVVYLIQSTVFLSHESHWISYAEIYLSWNLSPTVNRLSFSWNPLNLLCWNLSLSWNLSPTCQRSFLLMEPTKSLILKPLSRETYPYSFSWSLSPTLNPLTYCISQAAYLLMYISWARPSLFLRLSIQPSLFPRPFISYTYISVY